MSAIPETCKHNRIKNEIARIKEKCTKEEDQHENTNAFFVQLSDRGYNGTKPHSTKYNKKSNSRQPVPSIFAILSFRTLTRPSTNPSNASPAKLSYRCVSTAETGTYDPS